MGCVVERWGGRVVGLPVGVRVGDGVEVNEFPGGGRGGIV
jgi:hypothetical protein